MRPVFSKQMVAVQGQVGAAGSVANVSSYNINNQGAGVICLPGGTASVKEGDQPNSYFLECTGSLGVWGLAGTNTITITGVRSADGVTISPNPTTYGPNPSDLFFLDAPLDRTRRVWAAARRSRDNPAK